MNKPQKIIVHTTDASYKTIPTQLMAVDSWHKARWPEFKSSMGYWVGYHYLIEASGKICQTRAEGEPGAHTIGYNEKSIGIALAFDGDIELPTEAQMKSLKKLMAEICSRWNIPVTLETIQPHRKFTTGKTCYGSLLSDEWAYRLLVPAVKDDESIKKQLAIHSFSPSLIDRLVAYIKDYFSYLQ